MTTRSKPSPRWAAYLLGVVTVVGTTYGVLTVLAHPAPDHVFFTHLDRSPQVIAHRGGAGLWPENTLTAFRQSARLGVDLLEMDVRSTADGALVVIHDETVDRTTDGSGPVTGFTLDELQQLDAGYRWTADEGETFPFRGQGITIPTFEAVLTTFPTTSMIVDIKQADPPIVAPFCTLIREHQMAERVIVGSFDDATLNTFRETCPEVATSATAGEVKALVILSKLFLGRLHSPKGVALQVPEAHDGIHILSRRFIKTAHQRNLCIQAWTINEEDDMRRLIAEGVDGIISDYPDRLLRVVGER